VGGVISRTDRAGTATNDAGGAGDATVEFLVLDRQVFIFADFIAPPLVPGLDHFADKLLFQSVAGLLVDLPEAHPFAR
jgi:hypothetical protein